MNMFSYLQHQVILPVVTATELKYLYRLIVMWLECVANADEQLGEMFLAEKSISTADVKVK